MRSTLVIVGLAASIASAATLPLDTNVIALKDDGDFHTEAITHVYLCRGPNFGAPCFSKPVYTTLCYNFIHGRDNSISSVKPDLGTTCIIYEYVKISDYIFSHEWLNEQHSSLTSTNLVMKTAKVSTLSLLPTPVFQTLLALAGTTVRAQSAAPSSDPKSLAVDVGKVDGGTHGLVVPCCGP
ncbi:hypothetical protein NPX13_g5006 [Xylaria arbuscula]|uniref:Uncharacterized protein n=1 Tax=Xylaria arbuscula TaxID=114810 RepID=A0A9W8NET2_9PEZI|nr:hypothetical protein NPX13_g5006 [Xylaria arbuscula]